MISKDSKAQESSDWMKTSLANKCAAMSVQSGSDTTGVIGQWGSTWSKTPAKTGGSLAKCTIDLAYKDLYREACAWACG
jgi:hypothetical protein